MVLAWFGLGEHSEDDEAEKCGRTCMSFGVLVLDLAREREYRRV